MRGSRGSQPICITMTKETRQHNRENEKHDDNIATENDDWNGSQLGQRNVITERCKRFPDARKVQLSLSSPEASVVRGMIGLNGSSALMIFAKR